MQAQNELLGVYANNEGESVLMNELTKLEIEQKLEEEAGTFAVFFYTPLCGTCKLAERMLHIVLEMYPDLPLYKSNINLMSELGVKWKITNVPSLVIFKDKEPLQKVFAMKSVDFLYNVLKPLSEAKEGNYVNVSKKRVEVKQEAGN